MIICDYHYEQKPPEFVPARYFANIDTRRQKGACEEHLPNLIREDCARWGGAVYIEISTQVRN